jgi:membrane-bound ClpP family serine protease
MDPLVWAALLMLLAMALVVLEIFSPPPYGIIGFLAVAAAAASIYLAFESKGPAAGFIFVAVAMIGLPAVLGLAIRYWPNPSMGRRILLDVLTGDEVLPEEDPRHHLQQLVGQTGHARTVMLPGGAVSIAGRTYEAVSEGMPIEGGAAIEVVQVRHNRLVVRPAEATRPPSQADDVLSRPIDTVVPDPFRDPLA